MIDDPIVVTFFSDQAATTSRREALTLEELANRIAMTSAPTKQHLPWLKLTAFGDVRSPQGSLRHNANMISISGVEVDYDGEKIPFDGAVERVEKEGIEALLYTSPSHMLNGHGPRWRGLFPLSGQHKPEERDRFVSRIAGLFRDGNVTVLAPESWTRSQAYYFGAIDHNPEHRVKLAPGLRLDHPSFDDLDLIALGKPDRLGPVPDDTDPGPHVPGQPEADIEDIRAALTIIPNDWVEWNQWNILGLAVFAASAGSQEGWEAFDAWSRQSKDYDETETARMWNHFHTSPPTRSGFGSLVYWARQADPTFIPPSRRPRARPIVHLVGGELPAVIDRAEAILIASDPGIYTFGDQVARTAPRPIRLADGRATGLRVVPIGVGHMIERFTREIDFRRYDRRQKTWGPVDCPNQVAAVYLERVGLWRLPKLAALTTCPLLLPGGRILDRPGYDAASGVLFDPQSVEFPPVPPAPTEIDARHALDTLKAPFAEFPFVDDKSRSVLWSALLSAVARPAVPFVPAHAFDAPAAGTGKSKLVDCVSILLTGRECAVVSQADDEVEFEKKIGAVLLAGDPIVSIDNCTEPVSSPLLCMALTQTTIQIRILGMSKTALIPNNALIFVNGNNLSVVGDLLRRTLVGKLDAGVERPELRTFQTEDPVVLFKRERPRLVSAALTVLRAYIAAGAPYTGAPLGGFEEWHRLVPGALAWLGEADPLTSIEEARAADPELQQREAIFARWWDVLHDRTVTTQEVITEACSFDLTPTAGNPNHITYRHPEFRSALLEVAEDRRRVSPQQLGIWLGNNKNKVVGEHRIVPGKMRDGNRRWRMQRRDNGKWV